MTDEPERHVLVVRLDAHSVEQLAHRVADLIDAPARQPIAEPAGESGRLLSAAQVAERWGVDRSWVYDHANDLGAMRLGSGARPRLRFDPERVAAYLNPATDPPERPGPEQPSARRGRGRHVRRSSPSAADCAEGLPFAPDPELTSVHQPRRPGGAATPPGPAPKRRTRSQ